MLLYQHQKGHYLAVALKLRFTPSFGYSICFDGQDVPEIICLAFIRESGGQTVREDDTIELKAEPVGSAELRYQRRRSGQALSALA